MNRPRLATSELPPNTLHAMYVKAEAETAKNSLITRYGNSIPMDKMPIKQVLRTEVFILLRREGYRPNYDQRIYININ